jgi:hypothetical protein
MIAPDYKNAPNYDNRNLEPIYVPVYNNTGADIPAGTPVTVAFLVDATDPTNPIIKPAPLALATIAAGIRVVGIVDNRHKSNFGGALVNATWGEVCVQGVCNALVDGTTDVTVGDQLEGLNTATSLIQGAAASAGASAGIISECIAIAMKAQASSTPTLVPVLVLGRMAECKSS